MHLPSYRRIFQFSIWILTLTQAALCSAAPQVLPQAVKFRLLNDYLVIVTVEINGHHSYDFMVDTASSGSVIDVELARELHLRPADYLQLVTLTGQKVVPRTYVERFRVGPQTVDNFELVIEPLAEIRNLDRRVRGVLGQNFLARYDYLLDYQCKCLTFDDGNLQSRIAGKAVDFINDEGKMLVSVEASPQHPEAFLLTLDSGIPLPLLFHDAKVSHLLREKDWEIRDLAGSTGGKEIRFTKLKIGDRELSDQRCVVLTGQDSNRSDDGLLPLHIFRAVYFDNQRRRVIFDPQWVEQKIASTQIVNTP